MSLDTGGPTVVARTPRGAGTTSWHSRPATSLSNKGCQEGERHSPAAWALNTAHSALPHSLLWKEGPRGQATGTGLELGGHRWGVEGAGKILVTAALRTSLVWGHGAHREERWTGGGPWGPGLPTGRLSEGRVPRRWIRSPWTQCARGGRGSRLSSPRHVAGWACWRPPRPRARAAAAPAAGCAGTSPRSSAAAASGTR